MPDTARQPRQPRQPRPFSGCYLEISCQLDAALPGFLNSVLRASDLRRAAIFATLAEIKLSGIDDVAASLHSNPSFVFNADLDAYSQIARALMASRAREIVRSIFGSVPDGYLGLLARLGADPLPVAADYRLAFDLFNEDANRARAKLLRQVEGQLSPSKIRVAAKLDPLLLCKPVLDRVYDVQQVEALHAALSLIRSLVPNATDEVLHRSLAQVSPSDRNMSKWVLGWLRQMQHVPVVPPIAPDDADLRLVHGCEMPELGRRFRNCAAERIGYVALGTRLIYEWIGPGEPAVVELRCLQGGRFVIEDIRAARNANPSPAVASAIRARLSAAGVFSYTGHGRSRLGDTLVSLVGAWDHGDAGLPVPFLDDLLRDAA